MRPMLCVRFGLCGLLLMLLTVLPLAQAQDDPDDWRSLAWAAAAREAFARGDQPLAVTLALIAADRHNPPIAAQRTLADVAYAPGVRYELASGGDDVSHVAFSTDDRYVRVERLDSAGGRYVTVWALDTQTIVDTDAAQTIPFREPATLDSDLDIPTLLTNLYPLIGNPTTFDISSDGRHLVAGYEDGRIRYYDLERGDLTRRFVAFEEGSVWMPVIVDVAFSPDGRYLVGSGGNPGGSGVGELYLWDVETGTLLRTFRGEFEAQFVTFPDMHSLSFSPDGRLIAASSDGGYAFVWDVETGEIVLRMETGGAGLPITFSADGTQLLVSTMAPDVRLLEAASGDILRTFVMQSTESITAAALSGDGARVIGANAAGQVRAWDAQTGEQVRQFAADEAIRGALFAPDNNHVYLLTDSRVLVWNSITGDIVRSFYGHDAPVFDFALSSDARRLLAVSQFSTIIWDVASGDVLRHIPVGESAAFSPNGRYVALGAELYNLSPLFGTIAWTRNNRYARPLTCAERMLYNVDPQCE